MKIRTFLAVLATIGMWAAVVQADSIVGTYKTVTLDGVLSEWTAADLMYPDAQIGDGTPPASTYANIYVANDLDNLYFGLDVKGSGGASVNNTWTRNVYIDADNNGGTGFNAGWMTGGHDRLVQYGASGGSYSVNAFLGDPDQVNWNWGFLNTINYSFTDSIVEMAIPLTDLGVGGTDTLRLEFNVTGTGVTLETWAHQVESSAGTYTLAVPEPAAATLLLLGSLVLLRRRTLA